MQNYLNVYCHIMKTYTISLYTRFYAISLYTHLYAISLYTHLYAQFLLQIKDLLFGKSRYLRVLVIEVPVERRIINLIRGRKEGRRTGEGRGTGREGEAGYLRKR